MIELVVVEILPLFESQLFAVDSVRKGVSYMSCDGKHPLAKKEQFKSGA